MHLFVIQLFNSYIKVKVLNNLSDLSHFDYNRCCLLLLILL